MTAYGNLNEKKKAALTVYKKAEEAFRATITPENIKGDAAKWKGLCDARRVCMMLGVRI